MNTQLVFVFDIDGVLLDVRERLQVAEELSKGNRDLFWRYFFSEDLMHLDKSRPIGIKLLLDRLSRGFVAIITGRPESLRHITLKQLRTSGIPVERIWRLDMRPRNDKRKSYRFKLERILSIHYEGFTIAEIHDDDEEVLSAIRRYIPNARLFLHTDDHVIELFKSKLW